MAFKGLIDGFNRAIKVPREIVFRFRTSR